MAVFEKEVTVDLSAENKYNCLAVKQGDFNSRFIRMTVLAEGVKYAIPENEIVYLRCLHENGIFDIAIGSINDDTTISFEIPKKVIANSGTAICDLAVVKGTESTLSSSVLTLVINKSAIGGNVETDDGVKTPSELFAMLTDTIAKSHKHDNSSVLGLLGVSEDNNLMYNGNKVGGSLEIKTIEFSTSQAFEVIECMICPFWSNTQNIDFVFNASLLPENIIVLGVDFCVDDFWYSGCEVCLSGNLVSDSVFTVHNYPYSYLSWEGFRAFATITDSSGTSDLANDGTLTEPVLFKKVRLYYVEV